MRTPPRISVVLLVCLAAALLLTTGCRKSQPMYVPMAEQTVGNPSMTLDKMAQAIKEATAGRNWEIYPKEPGHMVAVQRVRTHTAVVDIFYTATTFSIRYKSSDNLNDDGNGHIHAQYNTWVRNLERDIRIKASYL